MIAPLPDPPTDTPPGLIRWRGVLRPRRVGLVFNLRRLTCLDGHRVAVHGRVVAGGLQCHHRAHPDADPCGAWVLLLWMASDPAYHRRRRFWAADVTLEELEAVELEHLDAEQTVERFGGIFPTGRVA